MFSPKYPTPDTPPAHVPAPYIPTSLQAAPARPAVRLTPGSVLTLVAGGGALVLVVGTVLVSLLLAVAVTAASVAVCAVVVRSILQSDRR
ncbi:SpdD protein [Streptomyces cyaneofuscatus]|uniref:SpdD protein n=1 Tax=Streptomyces cyaneofuscatus TaxID=66883 RepID=UPI003CF3C2CD